MEGPGIIVSISRETSSLEDWQSVNVQKEEGSRHEDGVPAGEVN